MNSLKKTLLAFLLAVAHVLAGCSQQTVRIDDMAGQPEGHSVIPDKVFEVGIPLLILLIIMHTLISILKNRSDNQTRVKAIERGVSEDALIKLFGAEIQISSLQPLKWFLLTLSLGVSLITLYFLRPYLGSESGYLAVGIVLIVVSIGLFVYYTILRKKLNS